VYILRPQRELNTYMGRILDTFYGPDVRHDALVHTFAAQPVILVGKLTLTPDQPVKVIATP